MVTCKISVWLQLLFKKQQAFLEDNDNWWFNHSWSMYYQSPASFALIWEASGRRDWCDFKVADLLSSQPTVFTENLVSVGQHPGFAKLPFLCSGQNSILLAQTTQLAVRGKQLIKQSHTPQLMSGKHSSFPSPWDVCFGEWEPQRVEFGAGPQAGADGTFAGKGYLFWWPSNQPLVMLVDFIKGHLAQSLSSRGLND